MTHEACKALLKSIRRHGSKPWTIWPPKLQLQAARYEQYNRIMELRQKAHDSQQGD